MATPLLEGWWWETSHDLAKWWPHVPRAMHACLEHQLGPNLDLHLHHELALHARRPADVVHSGRPRASARWRRVGLTIRSQVRPRLRVRRLLMCELPGQVSASLAGMARTIEDYDSMARREMIKAKQEKAAACVLVYISGYSEA